MQKLDITTIAGTVTLTRKEKLLRWARLIRESAMRLHIYNEMEYWPSQTLAGPLPNVDSAFTLAAKDPIFASMGFGPNPSVNSTMKFFGLSLNELHVFSCDCGGHIDNKEMARRVEYLANC
jgi:hypothetical protein